MSNDDVLLVNRFKKGDESAFDELVNRYKEKVYYLAYKMTNEHATSLDISQQAFIKAHRSIHWFWGKSSFYSWVLAWGKDDSRNISGVNKAFGEDKSKGPCGAKRKSFCICLISF